MIGIAITPKFIILIGCLLSLVFYLFFNKKTITNWSVTLFNILSLWYIVCLISITLFPIEIYWETAPYTVPKSINLIPFKGFLITSIKSVDLIFITNIFGNLFLLTPLSIILGIKFTSHIVTYKKSLLHGLCISILIELLQYVELIIFPTISRSVDITDVILNSIGFVIGHFIYKTLFKKTKNVVK